MAVIRVTNVIFKSQVTIYSLQIAEDKIKLITDFPVKLIKAASVRNGGFVTVFPD